MNGLAATLQRQDISASRDWLRALERTAPIARHPHRILPVVIDELAEQYGNAPALVSERETFSFRSLSERTSQYARWALQQGIRKGDVVALLMDNRPEYFAAWLGITAAGGVVALLNTNLVGRSLGHCIDVVRPSHVIVATEFAEKASTALATSVASPKVWIHGADHDAFFRIDSLLDQISPERLSSVERPDLSIDDVALNIYTSGTTGLPKAAYVSHGRLLQWAYWFAGMLDVQQEDRIYNCLPMYHSIGGVLVPGAALVSGASVAIRESFSATQFWDDVARWDCTMFQYIGEFCRYLLNTAETPNERNHRIRLACGNGLSGDVWRGFQKRFNLPRIVEFYASTEGGLSLFNAEGEPGSIGRVPPYLAHRYSPVLVKFDPEAGDPIRDHQGFCIRCEINEPGEALARFRADSSQAGSRFEGYTDRDDSERKLLRNVFESGDVWVRTGDLLCRDARGFFYFVDRVGDTFRWKGENVATTEVAQTVTSFPGVLHAVVYGVKVGTTEGRAGMAALNVEGELDLSTLRGHIADSLPPYARPAFLRLRRECELTGTLKYSKSELIRQGFDPDLSSDAIYFDNPETQTLQPVDRALFDRIQSGQIRF
jgi:fatty-acyl-CoA synthase